MRFPGAVTLLHDALGPIRKAGLAVGASIHRASEADKLKVPSGYGSDRQENARKYLANELRSITIGSALVAASEAAAIRFPEYDRPRRGHARIGPPCSRGFP